MRIIKDSLNFIMDTMETIVFIGTLYIVVYIFLFSPSAVQGSSMEPNLHPGDRLITSKVTYKLRGIERGDIVVVNSPHNPDIQLIKRVIGLPEETIEVEDGEVYIDGDKLPDEYISVETPLWPDSFLKNGTEYKIPEDQYIVMGDNRPRSLDSRTFGPISRESIVSQAIYRYFPPSKKGSFENPFPEEMRK